VHGNKPSSSEKVRNLFIDTVPRRTLLHGVEWMDGRTDGRMDDR
jgi:hypothetical protein